MKPASMMEAALAYASAGIPVFPCVPRQKKPLVERGLYAATTDLDLIREWWSACPAANIAMPTGQPQWDVLDVDVKNGASGYVTLARLHMAGLADGWSHATGTPSGGLHLYFAGTPQHNGSIAAHGIDFRGSGGYVLVPPSAVVVNGQLRRYRTLGVRHVGWARTADWSAIRDHLTPRLQDDDLPPAVVAADPSRRMTYLVRHVETRPEGHRHHALLWAAHRAIDNGSTDLAPLVAAATRAGLDRKEAESVVAHVRGRRLSHSSPRTDEPAMSVERR